MTKEGQIKLRLKIDSADYDEPKNIYEISVNGKRIKTKLKLKQDNDDFENELNLTLDVIRTTILEDSKL